MDKLCIFSAKKQCSECGDCYICDLDLNKRCDDCGKCLKLDNADMKSVSIDEIDEEFEIESEEDEKVKEYALQSQNDTIISEDFSVEENNESWELIDDIDGLEEIISDMDKFKNRATELFPGFIQINRG